MINPPRPQRQLTLNRQVAVSARFEDWRDDAQPATTPAAPAETPTASTTNGR